MPRAASTGETFPATARQEGMTPSLDSLVATREALHRLAEHVVSPSRYAQTGRIGLRPHPGGLKTPAFGPDDTVVRVELDEIVVHDHHGLRRQRVTTLREAAEFVGVVPGAPANVYRPATECDLDAQLTLDCDAMQTLADWYLLGREALAQLAADLVADDPSEAQLWPEHMDFAIAAAGVNYGFSPGDAVTPEPYVYVGPHAGRPRVDDFWNAEFGAVRTRSSISTVEDALRFIHQARVDLASTPATTEGALS
jgi:hypothetical protein